MIILSIGRKVEKKGYDDLLDALARLPPALHWRFEHIGGGRALRCSEGAGRRTAASPSAALWHGAQPQKAVFAALARADLFVLASKKAADGDQDGLPNVLMEAAHQGLAIVSTRAAAIGEFITDGENGLLVAPGAPDELAAALARLVGDPDLRRRLASRASEIVRTRFSFEFRRRLDRVGARPGASARGARCGVTDMRVLLHTPLKPPDSPTPSGDREMARGLARLLRRLGHTVVMPAASRVARRRAGAAGASRARTPRARAGGPPDRALARAAGRSSRALRSLVHLSLLLSQARLAGAHRHPARSACPM